MICSVSRVSGTSGMNSDGQAARQLALVADVGHGQAGEHGDAGQQHDRDQRRGHRAWSAGAAAP